MAAPIQNPGAVPSLSWRIANRRESRIPALGVNRSAPKPAATYRLQFHPGFGFSAAQRLIPFLHQLGVTHVYASPIFEARRGSLHGYDVVDPNKLRGELGSEDEFNAFARDLKRRGMGLILDIVPNHMAACSENPWWSDMLEDGHESLYASYFDIDWKAGNGKVVLPVLGAEYQQILDNGELQVHLEQEGFVLRYWDHRFPISTRSYASVLGFERGHPRSLDKPLGRLASLPAGGRVRLARKNEIKAELWRRYSSDPAVRQSIDAALARINSDRPALDRIISAQHYRPTFWRAARNEVNYRRFFDINDLVGMRVEDPEVLTATHALVFRLVQEGKVDGVRIDHIDGLYDPTAYLNILTDQLATAAPNRATYALVEKVMLGDERLHSSWPVHGATGYEFLDKVNSAFVEARNVSRLESICARFTGCSATFEDVVYEQKKRVLDELFGGELARLGDELHEIAASGAINHIRVSPEDLRAALLETTACLAVYRTYVRDAFVSGPDRRAIEAALERAALRTDPQLHRALAVLHQLLTVDLRDGSLEHQKRCVRFVMRWQQLTGPAMAKGMEDTACYRHHPLTSMNVVGGAWRPIEVEAFHQFAARRGATTPFALNASSTHDTKRSEDVRARIDVLSEIPDQWEQWLERWSKYNADKKQLLRGVPAPCRSDEILLYQVLLGAWPLHQNEEPAFRSRLCQFVVKAARESKLHTNWIEQNHDYESALTGFVDRILAPATSNQFLEDFRSAQALVSPFGAVGSLSQLLLKMTAPGVPDFYQGSLLWDFSLVDPDNRRPVDFEKRMRIMDDLCSRDDPRSATLADSLRASWRDGRIKMYTVWRTLTYRRAHADLFASGEYIPLKVTGTASRHVIAFARRNDSTWAVVIVPRLLATLDPDQAPFSCPMVWGDTHVVLPAGAPASLKNVYTSETLAGARIPVRAALCHFPIALLCGC